MRSRLTGVVAAGIAIFACVGSDPAPTVRSADAGVATDGSSGAGDSGARTDCAPGELACGSACVKNDNTNCGVCGNACGDSSQCLDGKWCSNRVVDMATGIGFSCAVRGEGSVWCWGVNEQRQTGEPGGAFSSNKPSILAPNRIEALSGIETISASAFAACAANRLLNKTVQCWGADVDSTLGRREPPSDSCARFQPDPLGSPADRCDVPGSPVADVSGAVQLAGGTYGFCARLDTGNVTCWGSTAAGYNPGESSKANLVKAPDGSDLAGVTSIASTPQGVGFSVGCAIHGQARNVSCWGAVTPGSPAVKMATRVKVNGGDLDLADAVAISVGQDVGAYAVLADGSVWQWTAGSQPATRPLLAERVPVPEPVIGVANGIASRFVWTEAGDVYAWGPDNGQGQLGTGDRVPGAEPRKLSFPAPIARVTSAGIHALALDVHGRLWTFGSSSFGELGRSPDGSGVLRDCAKPTNELVRMFGTACQPTPTLVVFP